MTAAGPPVSPEWALRAAAEVRRCPLRWHEGSQPRSPDQIRASGWFFGTAECALILGAAATATEKTAAAFGGAWPVFSDETTLVAPAVPVALGGAAVEAAGAEYERRPEGVWREAAGSRRLFIAQSSADKPSGRPFDLLWFEAAERYVLRRGELEIEDLFARLRLPAPADLVQRMLIRARRLPAEMLDGLPTASGEGSAQLEIERPVALVEDDQWRDPERFVSSRADIRSMTRKGSSLEVESEYGESIAFEIEEARDRWILRLSRGSYPLTKIALGLSDDTLCLVATLDDRIDPLAPGMRGRLVFDLQSDLVALG